MVAFQNVLSSDSLHTIVSGKVQVWGRELGEHVRKSSRLLLMFLYFSVIVVALLAHQSV